MTRKLSAIVTRREFAWIVGAGGVAITFARDASQRALAQPGKPAAPMKVSASEAASTPDASQIIKGKKADMIIHNAKLGVMETPLTELRKHEHTPKEILFNRFHFPHEGRAEWYATTGAPPEELVKNWMLRVDGLVERPRDVSIDDLRKMPQVKRVSVLQCAGNGRSFYAAKQKVAGGQWRNGGMGNVEWEGVELRPLLKELDLSPAQTATWLTAEGWDQPATKAGSDFAKSYHIGDPALDHAILALKMNGEPIPATHGGPVRLIIPGYYGNMNVKMLTYLMFAAEQSPSAYQSVGYRMPDNLPVQPGKFGANDYNADNSTPTYGHKIKSVIFAPLPEDKPKAGSVDISGVAFNDGASEITSVAVSLDGGKTWKEAQLKTAESPWAWRHWSLKAQLSKGEHVIMCRATDALGHTQPLDGEMRWNPRGYEWNGVDRVMLTV